VEHKCAYCGGEGKFQFKNGRWCCCKYHSSCPTGKKIRSESTTKYIKEHPGCRSGPNHPGWGTHRSEETKLLMSILKFGVYKGEDNPNWGNHPIFKNLESFRELRRIIATKQWEDEEYRKMMIERNKQAAIKQWEDEEFRNRMTGPNHPNYNPDRDQVFFPYTKEFKINIPRVLERDEYTCQHPKHVINDSMLIVHHINRDKKDSRIENLITLCDSCHKSVTHKDGGIWAIFYEPYFQQIAKISIM
jgi:5-methylcytosine-specific restriction endonuclease McrA